MLAWQTKQEGWWVGRKQYQDDLKQHLLVDLHEFLVPLIDIGRLAAVVVLVAHGRGVVLVVVAPLDDLLQDGLVDLFTISAAADRRHREKRTDVGNGNRLAGVAKIFEHVLDQDGAFGHGALW